IPPEDFVRLQKVVSDWWKQYASIDMLKVLIRQFKEEVGLVNIENTNSVMALFSLLKANGLISISEHALIFEAVKICRLDGVQSDINKIKPTFKSFKLEDVEIRIFSPYRQNLIRFGKNLDRSSITEIGYFYEINEKVHNGDPWLLICALEDNKVIKENSAEDLIKTLRSNRMGAYADILEPKIWTEYL
ncbi:uncharacterized protein LOC117112545, partial [Anneissia japonica]|uniref:uncharacterized protein LOC117112545 n=1 Tax=Anneissia japonica TaxID=1529436 RepID=UPI0014259544